MAAETEFPTRLSGKRLVLARAVWGVLVAAILLAYAVTTLESLTAPVTICDQSTCTMSVATAAAWRAAGLTPESGNFLLNLLGIVVTPLGFVLVAGLIVWRRSDDWMALLVSFSLIGLGPYIFTGASLALSARPGWNFISQVLIASASLAFTFLFYLFPDGRLVPRASKYPLVLFSAAWVVAVIATTNEILKGAYRGEGNSSPVAAVETLMTVVMWGGGIVAQVWRYARVSNAVQRQQTKWVVLGLVGPILTLLLWSVYFSQLETSPGAIGALHLLFSPLMALCALAFPASVGIAILHYRLWDIDLIIRRTLIYSTLTALLALFYLGSVIVLQQLLRGLTGQGADLAIILSTLGIAALFNPLHRRIQQFIDRRFYRRKYNAARVLSNFAMTVRDEVDLGRLTEELQRVVEDTMQPEQVSLWLKKSAPGPK